ncbi:hypothetical protein AUC61_07280 [Pseudomonas sp. S25]|uniref:DUF4123 domain-containing protein n=1 Tax=Pseudomonas maioricensis TaxID=1766623 RepID=A0ABS9ZFE3_9PSED|nr:DUF4123 domain-containing protein [Pseudomonas sp. S25]MCI8209335.1 hypothetical protein [Pseudomonas sp. S25]
MSSERSVRSQLPDDFSWDLTVGLLLDAIQVKNLLQRLYQWNPAPKVSVLYHGTRWAEISRLSPCLVRLHDADDPVLLQFLANTQALWGYLLICDGSWDELLAHMRWLTCFKPPHGEDMYLRISDPAVARALFAAERDPGPDLFGPCQQIVVSNAVRDGWIQLKRPGDKYNPQYDKPLVASDAQWAALKGVAFDKSMGELYQNMQRFFPYYCAELTPELRLEHIHRLARSAIDKGFETEQEIWLYANVFGFLRDSVLEQHPDIAELLTVRSELSMLERVERAAMMAAEIAAGNL